MRRNPAWAGQAATAVQPKAAKSIACLVFVTAMGAAFWAGAIWATLPLLN